MGRPFVPHDPNRDYSPKNRDFLGKFDFSQTGGTLTRERVAGTYTDDDRPPSVRARQAAVLAALGHSTIVTGTMAEREQFAHQVHQNLGDYPQPGKDTDGGQAEMVENYMAAGLQRPEGDARPFVTIGSESSLVEVVGGTSLGESSLVPGQAALAHTGVVFVPEAEEMQAHTLDALRGIERSGRSRTARGHRKADYPADIALVLGRSRCACGITPCQCSTATMRQFKRRSTDLSGPLKDRALKVDIGERDPGGALDTEAEGQHLMLNVRTAEASRGLGPTSKLGASGVRSLPIRPDALRVATTQKLSEKRWANVVRVARQIQDMEGRGNAPVDRESIQSALRFLNPK